MKKNRLGIMVDVDRCIGCDACTIACKAEHKFPEGILVTRIKTGWEGKFPEVVNFYSKHACMHCSDPACVSACPVGALQKTPQGIVAHDVENCVGCGYCAVACPFEVPLHHTWTDKTYKCDMCIQRVESGLEPACVATCPTGALLFGDREELMLRAEKRLRELKGEYPEANIYSPEEVGGTGLIYVLTDRPVKFGLPEHPQQIASVGVWQNYVKPYAGWLIPLALLASASSFVSTRILANKHASDEHKGGE